MKRFFIFCLAFIMLCGCVNDNQAEPAASNIQPTDKTDNVATYQLYRESLPTEQRKAYDMVYNTYLKISDKVTLPYMQQEDLENIIRAIINDHPNIYYLSDEYEYEVDNANQEYLAYHPKYRFDDDEIKKMNKEIDAIVDPIIQEAKKMEGDYEKVKYVYDYIIDQTDYIESSKENQNILSTFLYKKTVCAGYAKSMQYILSKLDIPCNYITGYPRYGSTQAHAWNMVKMDGDYYYMDITNADPVDGELTNEYRYIYFAMTKAEMLRLFVPDKEELCENAYATKANYFVRNNAYFTSFDTNQLEALVQKRLRDPNFSLIIQSSDADIARQLDNYIQSDEYLLNKTGISQFRYYELGELHANVYVPFQ